MNRTTPSILRFVLLALLAGSVAPGSAQDKGKRPVELEAIKASIGVWDAVFEVWPQGKDKPSVKGKGVETNVAHGDYWLASDLVSEFMGQTTKVHSIVGYDLETRKLIGKVIDHGPYMATLTGEYHQQTKTITWTTHVKTPDGKPFRQKTKVTQKSADERLLVLSMPDAKTKEFREFMRITFTRRK